ncbi:MAG: 2-oxoacid:ferredoxin oxidoreductase subunit gamma [Candidatus Omnitrophica bacterium CG23_combo_of_CG06-09_8_20_14_all_40_11]|nr:MAG: 2-oxoacid:ferredoxin oxidoreductase subunit gamma [Candidatus Omnitrophica bacterium CG23_combo_of_CG06-09_8_20_14_all_40_11]
MTERIIIAGAGGQGIMLLGKVMAEAAMREDKYVTWLPAYGAEVRGGTSHCMVVISDTEIGSPYIEKADTLIAMNGPSLKKFKNRIKSKGLVIINRSLAGSDIELDKNWNIIRYPFTDLAVKLGNIKVANMIALGCFISQKNIVDSKSVSCVIQAVAPEDKRGLIEINQKALLEGMKLK